MQTRSMKSSMKSSFKEQYDRQWPQRAPDPDQLASATTIEPCHVRHPRGGLGFYAQNEQEMKARLQEIARERAFLLECLAESYSQAEVEQLDALHKDANTKYQRYENIRDAHLSLSRGWVHGSKANRT